jgi:hypothetical protein
VNAASREPRCVETHAAAAVVAAAQWQAGRQLLLRHAFLFRSSFLPNNIISRKLLSSRSKIKQKI